MNRDAIRRALLCSAAALLALWVFFHYLLKWTAPFILAFLISRAIAKPVNFCTKRLRIPARLASLICTAGFFLVFGFALREILLRTFKEAQQFLESAPDISMILRNTLDLFKSLLNKLPEPAAQAVLTAAQKLISNGITMPKQLSSKLVSLASSTAAVLPDIFLFLITLFAATYFFSADYARMRDFLTAKLPPRWISRLSGTRTNLLRTVCKYLKALGILAAITFAELLAGFTVLGIDCALTAAFFTACIDALPVLGTGFVLIPWALGALVNGAYSRAIGLSVLYLTVTLVRNLLEARIIGEQIGIHPLASLASVYIGLRLFGAYGLFMPPILAVIMQSLRSAKRDP